MASPQTEDGYTRFANELLEAMLHFGFSRRELSLMLAIARKTYGYGKLEDDITVTQLAKIAGLRRQHASSGLSSLEGIGAVLKRDGKRGYLLKLNKNYEQWGRPKTGHVPKQDADRPKTGRQTVPKRDTQKKTQKKTTKENPLYPPLPDSVPEQAWADYVDHRKRIRKPLTEKAVTLSLNKLAALAEKGHPAQAVIDQTIERGWTGLFPLKGDDKPEEDLVWRDAI